jgi:hypothetical protein
MIMELYGRVKKLHEWNANLLTFVFEVHIEIFVWDNIMGGVDVLLGSLIDSNVNKNWKQQKNKELVHAPWLATLWG